MDFFSGKHYRKWSFKLLAVGFTSIFIGIMIIVLNPLQIIVENKLTMKPGTLLFGLWEKPPLEVYIKVYAFNITNWERFKNGLDKKLKVDEVGPYVYREYLENKDPVMNDNHTISFRPQRHVEFVREKSVGDPKLDVITAANIPYMGVTTAASKISILAAIAVRTLMRSLKSEIVFNMTVHDYLWGYDDPLVKLASTFIPGIIHFKTFGLLDRMFDEGENLVTVHLPQDRTQNVEEVHENTGPISERLTMEIDHEDVFNEIMKEFKSYKPTLPKHTQNYEPVIRDFSIDTWNGERGLSSWGYKEGRSGNTECNTLRGTYDGTLFPRNITKGETFRIYRKAFCRTLPIVYTHPGVVDGVDAYFFKLADNAFDSDVNDPTSSCFCSDEVCLKKGLGNITPCYYNIPAAVSFPHFYNADPSLLNSVEGLNPSEEKHGTEIVLQPQLGVPMKVHTRFQINLLMGDIKFNADMQKFRNTVLPIVWVEIAVESLTPGLLTLLHLLFNVGPYLQTGITILLMVSGISILGLAVLMFLFEPKTPVKFNPKKDMKYSAMYLFPLIKKEMEKLSELTGEENECLEV